MTDQVQHNSYVKYTSTTKGNILRRIIISHTTHFFKIIFHLHFCHKKVNEITKQWLLKCADGIHRKVLFLKESEIYV